MFCGLCVEACPYDALHMGTDFEKGTYIRDDLVLDKETLISQEKNPSSWFRPQFESAEYDPWKESLPDSKKAGRHEKPTYENMMTEQIKDAIKSKGKGDLEKILLGNNSWNVE